MNSFVKWSNLRRYFTSFNVSYNLLNSDWSFIWFSHFYNLTCFCLSFWRLDWINFFIWRYSSHFCSWNMLLFILELSIYRFFNATCSYLPWLYFGEWSIVSIDDTDEWVDIFLIFRLWWISITRFCLALEKRFGVYCAYFIIWLS